MTERPGRDRCGCGVGRAVSAEPLKRVILACKVPLGCYIEQPVVPPGITGLA